MDSTITDSPPLQKHRKFIVFEDNLLSLFNYCSNCGNKSEVTKKIMGTCIHISQHCLHCSHVRDWYSQPFVKNSMPAGNILLSAAILFSGALPSMVFRMLKFFGCVCTDKRTFFRHQIEFLHPTVVCVWKEHQKNLLQDLHKEKRGLILGGDGRADSPGHSAKFGSYSIMELKKKVILDMQLVQVRI